MTAAARLILLRHVDANQKGTTCTLTHKGETQIAALTSAFFKLAGGAPSAIISTKRPAPHATASALQRSLSHRGKMLDGSVHLLESTAAIFNFIGSRLTSHHHTVVVVAMQSDLEELTGLYGQQTAFHKPADAFVATIPDTGWLGLKALRAPLTPLPLKS